MPVWKVGDVQNAFVADTHGPGFVLQQEGRPPSLTLIFKDEKTAKRARKKFQEIIDSSDAILANPPTARIPASYETRRASRSSESEPGKGCSVPPPSVIRQLPVRPD